MSDAIDREREDATRDNIDSLKALVTSPGWQLFLAQAQKEWGGEGYGRRMKALLTNIPAGPDRALQMAGEVEKIDAASDAVNELLTWPKRTIAAHAQAEQRKNHTSIRERFRRAAP